MGEEKCKSQKKKKKNEISIGEENVKVKEKKRMKYESSLEFVEKEKDVTKLFRMNERPNMNFWPIYYGLCKEF